MTIIFVNDLAMRLVADDFSGGHMPSQGGPTKTSRAMAMIHLAAHDAYALATGAFPPNLGAGLPAAPAPGNEAAADAAMVAAATTVAVKLYPDFESTISSARQKALQGADAAFVTLGDSVGQAWIEARSTDQSDLSQEDTSYRREPGRHRPDPYNPGQKTLGRNWGRVKPFVVADIENDVKLEAPPALTDAAYGTAYDQVYEAGAEDIASRGVQGRTAANVGIFWGYDGSNKLGTPPRLYNQVVRSISDVAGLSTANQVRLFAAINVAMADAGIAAWHWKYFYDLWRPVVAIREADKGWGPTGQGDGNQYRTNPGNPYWLPLGAPASNSTAKNFTPNFPAYPSGHASFGTACFEVAAALLGKSPSDISVTFVSDEFNGVTTDNRGTVRPRWESRFTLREAIEQNKISRIYLGVHWIFDAAGGEVIGKAIAPKAAAAFAFV